jgi:hypothetical protein
VFWQQVPHFSLPSSSHRDPDDLMIVIGSGLIICSSTLWEYSIMFAPYVLTGLCTILILLSILNWWEKSVREDSWKHLFIIALLFGVDFSVHRTKAVLMPDKDIIERTSELKKLSLAGQKTELK